MAVAVMSRSRWKLLGPAFATVIVLCVFAAVNLDFWTRLADHRGYLRPPTGNDPATFIRAGSMFAGHPERLTPGAPLLRGTGYDGQFYFYMAQDPFLVHRADTLSRLDTPAYRYQRIGYPLAAWVLSGGGDPAALEWVLPLLNIAALALLAYFLAGFLVQRAVSGWWALLAPLSMGAVVGVVNDLADPFAGALFVVGLLLWAEGRRDLLAGSALALAALSRELYVAPLIVIVAVELFRRRRAGLVWLLPCLPVVAWSIWTRVRIGDPTATDVEKPSLVPFKGVVTKLSDLLSAPATRHPGWQIAFILVMFAGWALVSVAALLPILQERGSRDRDRWVLGVGLAGLVLVPFLTVALWGNPLSYTRYAVVLPALLVVVFGMRRWFGAALVASALLLLTLWNPLIHIRP